MSAVDKDKLSNEKILDLRTLEFPDYGIEFLTGEACSIGTRNLYDLTEEGRSHLENFFGRVEITGRGVNQGDASVLLPASIFPELGVNIVWNEYPEARWILQRDEGIYLVSDAVKQLSGSHAIAKHEGNLSSFLDRLGSVEHGYVAELLDGGKWYQGKSLNNHPRRGDKNVHQFTGKTHPA